MKEKPRILNEPSGQSEYHRHCDEKADPPGLAGAVGKTERRCHLRCWDDLHSMLMKQGEWMSVGSAVEQKPATKGTVEERARSPNNPVKGWYGLKKRMRVRFAMYLPPMM